ncbi:recombinase family protein [Streptomyces endophytica]|uniref:Recombinase family protein n=1 Tax=Streptomyces endophytica TaxID=2991496 RepID=A0ABY6P6X3_9ACTN|nr:recombinase family protein [Streptomyces endophytica]UZJ29358.1 recombinase family protein [Streptomyces endophytica]
MARVLGVVRLSARNDQSTSIERQIEKIEGWADLFDHEIAGWAVDDGVSAKISPWDRPELGPWLKTPEKYDIIVSWKLDRLSRSMKDFANLCEWSEEHDVQLVCIDDKIDLSSAVGRLVANILAAFAEFERLTIQHRVQQGFEKVFSLGRWRGGPWPYGYRPEMGEDGHLWLQPWTESRELASLGTAAGMAPVKVISGAVEWVLAGNSATSYVSMMNKAGIPLPSDAQRIANGKKPAQKHTEECKATHAETCKLKKHTEDCRAEAPCDCPPGKWSGVNLLRLLRSKRLLGYMVRRDETKDPATGKTIKAEYLVYKDGKPVRQAPRSSRKRSSTGSRPPWTPTGTARLATATAAAPCSGCCSAPAASRCTSSAAATSRRPATDAAPS